MQLTPRQHAVLTTIVDAYIDTARPVGSRAVSKASGLSLSPASMRNTMAELAEAGYLEQPHTSAGRVPTTKAFAHCFSSSPRPGALPDSEQRHIRDALGNAGAELTSVLRHCSRLLSDHARQMGMVLAPGGNDVRWKSIDFVLVRQRTALAVLVLEGGMVQNRLVEVDDAISRDDLTAYGNYLNHHYAGQTLSQARARILAELGSARRRLRLYTRALALARDAFAAEGERDLFCDGALHLLGQPEFSDVQAMRELLHMLDDKKRLLELLERTMEAAGPRIGVAAAEPGAGDYGLVSAPYGGPGAPRGVIGVIGPLRMDYAKVVPVVDFTARMLTELLETRY
jgi:heat-inducible transcriptional repressor